MTDAYDTLREMLANVPDDAQVYVEELESIVEWPGITAGTFRALLAEIAGFEWGWEQREKAHDAALAEVTKERDAARESKLGIAQESLRADNEWRKVEASLRAQLAALAQPKGTDLAVPVDILSNEWWEREVGEAK
jgi:hypothetical protein